MFALKRLRDVAICALLLALPFFTLRSNLKTPENLSWFDSLVLRLGAPLQYVATLSAEAVSGAVQEYIWLVGTERENQGLRSQLRDLSMRHRQLEHDLEELPRLKRLLALKETRFRSGLAAKVIGREVTPFFRTVRVRLDLSEPEGISAGTPVVTSEGLVGQIRRSGDRFSDVLLIADRASAVDIVIRPSGARGILKGVGASNNYDCRVEYLATRDSIEVGNEVVTSGLDQRFPEGILVGTVETVRTRQIGLHQDISVTPAVDFGRLQEVLVLGDFSKAAR